MARPGTLCIATVTVLVILAAAVQPGAVEYIPRGGSMGSMEPPLLKGCLRKYYSQTCARTLVTPFTNSSLRLGMAICYISVWDRALISPRLTRITNCFAVSICSSKRSQALLWPNVGMSVADCCASWWLWGTLRDIRNYFRLAPSPDINTLSPSRWYRLKYILERVTKFRQNAATVY